MKLRGQDWDEHSKERAFQAWYSLGRPSINSFAGSYTDLENHRSPGQRTLQRWCTRFSWHARADALDAPAVQLAESTMIEQRSQMLLRHQAEGRLLQQRGIEYLQGNPLTNDHAAVRAIETGIALERQVLGMPQLVAEIIAMSTDELREFISTQQQAQAEEEAEHVLQSQEA